MTLSPPPTRPEFVSLVSVVPISNNHQQLRCSCSLTREGAIGKWRSKRREGDQLRGKHKNSASTQMSRRRCSALEVEGTATKRRRTRGGGGGGFTICKFNSSIMSDANFPSAPVEGAASGSENPATLPRRHGNVSSAPEEAHWTLSLLPPSPPPAGPVESVPPIHSCRAGGCASGV